MVDVCWGKQLNGPDLLSVQGNLWSGSQLVETEKEILQAGGLSAPGCDGGIVGCGNPEWYVQGLGRAEERGPSSWASQSRESLQARLPTPCSRPPGGLSADTPGWSLPAGMCWERGLQTPGDGK